MALTHKSLAKLTEVDLQGLLMNKVREGKDIDYKQSLPGNADSEKREFLADVSSFANTNGGHLVYGIKEVGGVPTEIPGLTIPDIDATIQRFENLIRDGLQPRLNGVQIVPISLTGGAHVLVCRVPRSWALPHRVVLGGHDKFYGRNMSGKYPLDVPELRALILLSDTLAERVRSFRASRLDAVESDETPVGLIQGPKTVLHLIPANAFTPGVSYDVWQLKSGELPPINSSGWTHRLNFDGLVTFSDLLDGLAFSYSQVFRDGCIEAVDASMIRAYEGKRLIPGNYWERHLIKATEAYLRIQGQLGVQPPIVLMISVLGVRGYRMHLPWGGREAHAIDRDNLVMSEIILESFDIDASQTLRPLFDALWNASGISQSTSYDREGKWKTKND
jgi:hypothetical protein